MNWATNHPKATYEINGLRLLLTGGACPEQYDVFRGGERVGYLRLRHGEFRAAVPDVNGETVYYTEEMRGDGQFVNDERSKFLTEAVEAIQKHLAENDRTITVELTQDEIDVLWAVQYYLVGGSPKRTGRKHVESFTAKIAPHANKFRFKVETETSVRLGETNNVIREVTRD